MSQAHPSVQASPAAGSTGTPLTPLRLELALARGVPESGDAVLAAGVRALFGAQSERLRRGPDAVVDDLAVAWAVEAPEADAVRIVADVGRFSLPLVRLDDAGLFAGAKTLPSGTVLRWSYEITAGGLRRLLPEVNREQRIEQQRRRRGIGQPLEVYATHPDSRPQPGVPRGTVTAHTGWQSTVYAGTTRDWWVYVPAQYRPEAPASVMVFQDGSGPRGYVPTVFDNLIACGDMPVTVGIFINPGVFADGRRNRSFEYDTLSDQYSRFLLDEIIPEVERTVRLRSDAASRAISGLSSGGICAFTVAWQRPDAFAKVLSWIGSFTNIAAGESGLAGGHNYPSLIRATPPKDIRVFLQDGENDLDVGAGDWWLANLTMASALEFAGYDYAVCWGRGFHSPGHGRAILPDSLRWLWRGWSLA